MEVCVDSVESSVIAVKGGASRLELCGSLCEGGITPSLGLLRVVKQEVNVPVFVMVRPRGGDFVYSEQEFEVMKEDLRLFNEDRNADGFVFGVLTPNGEVDETRCSELIELAHPQPTTFHCTFDMTRDPFRALDTLIRLKMERVLTSGQESTALEGLPLIKELVERSRGQITVVAGGGITERNLERILKGHCSAQVDVNSLMSYRNTNVCMGAKYRASKYTVKLADISRVQKLLSIVQSS